MLAQAILDQFSDRLTEFRSASLSSDH